MSSSDLLVPDYNGKFIVADLDGTICDSAWRGHLASHAMWDDFHSASSMDRPNQDVVDLVRLYSVLGAEVVCITGRPEKWRSMTMNWLIRNDVPVSHLCMRPDDDFRPDWKVKVNLFEIWLLNAPYDREDHLFILEDREKVVEAWRSIGMNCYQVREGIN